MDPNVLITIAARLGQLQAGLNQATAALTAAVAQMKSQLNSLSSSSAASSNAIAQSMQKAGTHVRGLSMEYLKLQAAFKAYNLVSDFVKMGVETNAAMETARLGIASIITAQTKMKDASGSAVTGAAKLDAALQISAEQFQKLRIAGIQTAATTTELVESYQAALSAGLAAGLNFDQIRQISVRIVQAAQAMGMPMRYMREEVQSMLRGQITQNSVVAKNLGLTGAQVRLWIQQGDLAKNLLERLDAFGAVGEKVAQSWNGVTSNMREAFQVLSMEMSSTMFSSLEKGMNDALGRVFNTSTGTIAKSFLNVVAAGRSVFELLGSAASGALSGLFNTLERAGSWFVTNRVIVTSFFDAVRDVGSSAAGALGHLVSVIAELATELMGPLSSGFNALSAVLSSTTVQMVALALAARSLAISAFAALSASLPNLVALFQLLPAAIAGGASGMGAWASMAAGLVNPITLLVAALTAAGFIVERWVTTNQRAQQAALAELQVNDMRMAGYRTLASEIRKADFELRNGNVSDQRKAELQERIKDLTDQIIAMYPDLLKYMKDENGVRRDAIGMIEAQAVAEAEEADRMVRQLSGERDAMKLNIKAMEERLEVQKKMRAQGEGPGGRTFGEDVSFTRAKINADKAALTDLEARIDRYYAKVAPMVLLPPLLPDVKPAGDRVGADDGKDKSGELLRQWKENLEEIKSDNEDSYAWSHEFEQRFWADKVAQAEVGTKAYDGALREMNRATRAIKNEEYQGDLASIKTRLDAVRYDGQERVRIATEYLERVKANGNASRSEIEAAERQLQGVVRDVADKNIAAGKDWLEEKMQDNLALIDLDIDYVKFKRENGMISAQEELNQLRTLEQQKYETKLFYLGLMKGLEVDPEKAREDQKKIANETRDHNERMANIDRESLQKRTNYWKQFFSTLTSGFQNVVKGLVHGTMTFAEAFRNILGTVLDFFIDMLVEMLMNWIKNMVMTKIFGKSTAASQITAGAGVAAVNAMASVAAIPFVGWAMAPGVFAATLALGMGALSTLGSAAGGWDIPPGINPIVQAHAEEMILPAHIANPLRNMISSGSNGGGDTHNHYWNVNAIDARSFRDHLRRNQGVLVEVTSEVLRNGRKK